MSAPSITGLTAIAFTEGQTAVAVDQGVAFSGGAAFAGGSIRFSVASPTAGDQFTLGAAADPNASGAISVSSGVVYLGNGAGRDAIGSVDAMENGQNGQALKINLGVDTGVVTNPSFETDLSGWTIGQDRVILGQTVLNGWTTPNDPTTPPNAGDDAGGIMSMTYTAVRATDQHTAGNASLRLYNQGTVGAGYDVVHGPYAISNTFAATQGDVFTFDWRAAAGGDAYDAFGYLMNAADGTFQILVNETGADASGQKAWTAQSVVVPTDGQYFFVFVAGTYDFTGGQGVGGSLYVDNLRNLTSDADDATLKAITQAVLFQGTSDAPAAGARNVTIAVTDSVGAQSSATSTITIQNVNDAPTGAVAVAGTAAEGQTLTASNTIVDPDGNGTVSYQWQRADGAGGWTNIGGANAATYQLTTADIGRAVRTVASYTDGGGAAETVTSAATAAVVNTNDAPTGAVTVTGTATQGQVLTASNTLTDTDGLGTITYQWQRETSPGVWTNIAGGTGATYTLAQADVGRAVRARASYTDGYGAAEAVASTGTSAVANVNDAPTGSIWISGGSTAVVGGALRAQNSIADVDGLGAGLTYQWQRSDGAGGWTNIGGATNAQYDLAAADLGFTLRLVVSYTDGGGTAESLTSAPTAPVTEPEPDEPPAPPPAPPVPPPFDDVGNINLGTTANDTMSALGGDDEVAGGMGQDMLNGDDGDDLVYGNQGADTLHGGREDDVVRGGQDSDMVFGDSGDDYVFGDLGADRVDGGVGNDVLWGGQGVASSAADLGDSLFGGEGDDYANGNAGADSLDGGAGRDTLQGGRGDDLVAGGDGNDVVMGDVGADTLSGGAGADIFNAQGGGMDRIADFNPADGDRILLDAGATWSVAQVGADTVVTWNNGQIVLANVQAASLTGDWIV
jgi:Ca2+-binding RTX toxin-like protein